MPALRGLMAGPSRMAGPAAADDGSAGLIRCFSHGAPTPLARWHHHDVHELHIITRTSGQAFVGDWIGSFQPGQVILVGPRLPHHWVSTDLPEGGVAERDLIIQFNQDPLLRASADIPELVGLRPMLDRASNGIEFFGLSERAVAHWHRTHASEGLRRWAAFCELLADLVACTDHRELSRTPMRQDVSPEALARIEAIVMALPGQVSCPPSVADCAVGMGMSVSQFNRSFRRATGNTYIDFVNRVRIQRASQLLLVSQGRVAEIAAEVGFQTVASFNRLFLAIQGMTPSDYRRQAHERAEAVR